MNVPAELTAALATTIKNNSDAKFVEVLTGKSGGYYAVFEFENGHEIETLIGYTQAELAKHPRKGIVGLAVTHADVVDDLERHEGDLEDRARG